MNVWLCPVKPASWRIIKRLKVFGGPRSACKAIEKIKPDDMLIFHVFKPISGIVAICRVTSDVYEDSEDIWGKNRYPLRVRIEFIPNLQREESNTIPLCSMFGSQSGSELSVEPFLKNVRVAYVTKEQYEVLKHLFENTG